MSDHAGDKLYTFISDEKSRADQVFSQSNITLYQGIFVNPSGITYALVKYSI